MDLGRPRFPEQADLGALPDSTLLGKHFLEALPGLEDPTPGRQDAEGVGTGISGGAADALTRP